MKFYNSLLFIFLLTNSLSSALFAQEISGHLYSVLKFGALADGTTDNTLAFQKAIDVASVSGGMVTVPAGKYLIKGSLRLYGVSLKGENLAPRSWEPLNGTIILAIGGRDDERSPALFEMRNSSAVSGITVFYPEQSVDEVHAYPWTFHIGSNSPDSTVFDCTIDNVTLINSYNGIHAGPYENGRHRINNVFGCVLRRGIFVESVGDIGRIENVQFHCHFWGSKATNGDFWKIFNYMQANCEAFIIGRSDWEYMTNTFVFPAKIGYRFIHTENGTWSGECNGQFSGIAADATQTAIVVESIQSQGLLITNGQFNSHLAGRSTQIIVEKGCEGSIRFTNCGFWGPVKQNALILGNSNVSFLNCYFSSNNVSMDPSNPSWAIIAENGKLQVQDCTFDATQSDEGKRRPEGIWLKKGVKHAIITGNNGFNGVSIKNEIGEKAIIQFNEIPSN
ncbi:MAG: glycosyl hydrolase family 28-related protein [Bacteroidota bacterium]